ncbi:acyltransferase [Colletotrichum fioriniae PJ7]|uniref:Acyltransferase n=1 Tax=Colletotrichum fioriniae PJ7 TaxID=1445577 RepID=A0A010R5X4_9PEZI|nr:acyltransferase [Colletotrichum fioriniae PJ7]
MREMSDIAPTPLNFDHFVVGLWSLSLALRILPRSIPRILNQEPPEGWWTSDPGLTAPPRMLSWLDRGIFVRSNLLADDCRRARAGFVDTEKNPCLFSQIIKISGEARVENTSSCSITQARTPGGRPRPKVFNSLKMSPRNEGILDSHEWDEVKPTWCDKSKWLADESDWKPASLVRIRRPSRLNISSLSTFFWPIKDTKNPEKLRPTAYLDGLRGFAAFLVYWHHNQLWAHEPHVQGRIFENAFGYENKYHFIAFPGIRHLFTGGHFSVSVFFVISGYVLSAKPLSLIQSGDHGKFAENVGSALFRRWLRLYLPLMATTFFYMTFLHMFNIWVDNIERAPTWRDDVWLYYCELKNFSFVFTTGGGPFFSWNPHLWSIPVEMKGSVIVYTSLLAFSRCTRNARLWCEAGLAFYFMYIADGWYGAMFVMGMMLCDLDLLAKKNDLPNFFKRLEPAKIFIYYHLFAVSMYLGGVPSYTGDVNKMRDNRGWYYLSFLKPQAVFDYKWFYLFWAATLLVSAVPRIWWLKRFFETRFCQYLGRISFALYLVHGPVLGTLGDRLYTAVGYHKETERQHLAHLVDRFPLPKIGPLGLEPAFLIPHVIILPVTLWIAEIVTRFIDEPSVRIAQWLYRKTLPAAPAKV